MATLAYRFAPHLAVAMATLFPLSLPGLPEPGAELVERRVASMGTLLTLRVVAPSRSAALVASEAALEAVAAAERRLSTWREDTELAALNRHPVGGEFPLSPQLSAELSAVERVWRLTGGAFDPAIGPLVEAWDLRGTGRRPSRRELAAARAASGWRRVLLRPSSAVRRHPGVRLEEGGFGKGAALDAALAALGAAGAGGAMLDFGGQVAVLPDLAGWEVALSHPWQRQQTLAVARLRTGSLATSSNGPRRREGRSPHLLDPRTGRPAADFGALTVWAASALEADALSTGLFVLGPDAALAWAEEHPDYGVIVVEVRQGVAQLRLSPALAQGRLPLTIAHTPLTGER